MNGFALLLLAATLGVEYDWRTTEDGQIEYVLIVEPDFIPSLAEGSEIRSSVPPELESVQRLCIRIAPPANSPIAPRPDTPRNLPATAFRQRIGLRANTDPTTIFWSAKGQPLENTNVRYGWQPTKDGLQEYFVQIDPKFLRTLAPGDEIYTTLSTEAGRVDTFVVFSNTKQLPKVAGRPGAPLAGAAPSTSFPGVNAPGGALPGSNPPAAPPFGASSPIGAAPFPAAPLTSTTNPPPFAPLPSAPVVDRPAPFSAPGAFGGVNDNGSRVNPAGAYDQPAAPPTYGSNLPGNTPRPNLNAPNPLAGNTGFANDNYRGNDAFRNNDLRSTDPRAQPGQPDPYRMQPPADPRNDLFPAGSGAFANNQNPNGVHNTSAPLAGTMSPPSGLSNGPNNAPYRPNVGYSQDSSVQPPAYDNRLPANAPPDVNYRPNTSDMQMAALGTNTLRPGVRSDLPATTNGASMTAAERSWWLVFTSFFLFISIGANLYLGWTVMEFYSRYKLAVERLRTSNRG